MSSKINGRTYTEIEAQDLTPNDMGEHVILFDDEGGDSAGGGYLTGFKVGAFYSATVDESDGTYKSIDLRDYTVEVELDGEDDFEPMYCDNALLITGRGDDHLDEESA